MKAILYTQMKKSGISGRNNKLGLRKLTPKKHMEIRCDEEIKLTSSSQW